MGGEGSRNMVPHKAEDMVQLHFPVPMHTDVSHPPSGCFSSLDRRVIHLSFFNGYFISPKYIRYIKNQFQEMTINKC
jgi:hypothetical protein